MPFTTEEHWRHYADFLRWEMAFGGPSTQLSTTIKMSEGLPAQERRWRAFCYLGVYNVPYGEVLWRHVPVDASGAYTRDWLDRAFADKLIVTRIERRCVRRADWMTEYFTGVRNFLEAWPQFEDAVGFARTPEEGYEIAWERVLAIPRVGRYITIRTLEILRRLGLPIRTPDIRPRDAWSPRGTLQILFPDEEIAPKDNSAEMVSTVNRVSAAALGRLAEVNVSIDFYQLQVSLCEYRQSWKNKKQYPGRSLDSELAYGLKAEKQWGPSKMWSARRSLFPSYCLGEIGGWGGPRKTVGAVLANHGYTWSDLLFDYSRTTDFAAPVRR